MTSKRYFEHIRMLVAENELNVAIQMLSKLLENASKLDDTAIESARWGEIKNRIHLDLIDIETAQVNRNQIREGILELLREMEAAASHRRNKEDAKKFPQTVQISGKNLIRDSTINAGGSITVGDQNIQNFLESKTSRNLRLFLFLFVPVLVIATAILYFQYLNIREPVRLDVMIDNQSPNQHLPIMKGIVILNHSGKRDTQYITTETTFKAIPALTRNQPVRLRFVAEGFENSDTTFVLGQESITLPIRRDDTYALLFGTVVDEQGATIEEAIVEIADLQLSTVTDSKGQFFITIPTHQQRQSHRLKVQREGYHSTDRDEPVIKNRSARIQLIKISEE